MSKGRLTRNELSWLLTQEAQRAAERLRQGVQVLKTTGSVPAPPAESGAAHIVHLDDSLEALDGVVHLLGTLHQRGAAPRGRRGRIDLAALLWEIAPEARVSIEPGTGTEVFGDEADLRRMLHVLIGHGSGLGSTVHVRGEEQEVRVGVVLGPDTSATAETERAWLSRMAIRHGGRLELEGGMEALILPADEGTERRALLKELDEARKQGEAYARELASVFSHTDDRSSAATFDGAERFAAVVRLTRGIATELRAQLAPLAPLAPLASDATSEAARDRFAGLSDLASTLSSIGELDPLEPAATCDLNQVVRTILESVGSRAEKTGAKTDVSFASEPALVRAGPRSLALLVREVLVQALAASPKSGSVRIFVQSARSVRLTVDDEGPAVSGHTRRAPHSFEWESLIAARPAAFRIYTAWELATRVGGSLELLDSPSGGVRVALTFPPLANSDRPPNG